ncbi:MAG: hypothetical protein AB8G77_11245 [Rhodothermales bacterium]
MESTVVPFAIWAVVVLVGLGVLSILLFGVRSLMNGKIDKMSVLFIGLPVLLVVVLGLVRDNWAEAGILTTVVMIGLAVVAMFWTSIQGVFR